MSMESGFSWHHRGALRCSLHPEAGRLGFSHPEPFVIGYHLLPVTTCYRLPLVTAAQEGCKLLALTVQSSGSWRADPSSRNSVKGLAIGK